MIRHASPSRTITATSGGVHGATTWSCLIAPPSFLLIVAAGFLRAGSDAVNMTSITPATDKDLRAATSTQKHSARNFIDTCGSASPALRITALCIYQFWQYSALRPLAYLFTTRWPPQGGIPRSRSTGSPIPPRFSFPANSIDPTAVDISSPLRLTPSIRGSSQPFTGYGYSCNYGVEFSFWDVIFGTFYLPQKTGVVVQPERIGYPGGGLPDERNYLKLLLVPLGLYRPLSWFKDVLRMPRGHKGQQPAE